MLGTGEVLGGFEYVGTVDAIHRMVRHEGFQLTERPNRSLRLNPFAASLAIAPYGYSYPLPNCTMTAAGEVARSAWADRSEIVFFSLGRRFIPWSVQTARNAGRSPGNYCTCLLERGRFAVEVGLEQYSDSDPPVRTIRKAIDFRLSQVGLSLAANQW